MKPKIAYLIDESGKSGGWDNEPDWVFYEEAALPQWKIEHASKETYKRIVYWELEETD
jgi:hypothetical protein